MTRIDFYLLSSDQPATRLQYACRLAHKAWQKGHHVYLHCPDQPAAERLDELLWSFNGEAFLPHALREDHNGEPVVCGSGEDPGAANDLLINLSDDTPGFFSRFARLAEIVVEQDAIRVPARERFRFYRERGYPLQSHQIRTAG
ncbi:MAG: DNA polymerase III subunit chi [Halopseudomonas sp.]|uniref:DNA polymerase III subunit chi n=1 Tax=Halopseudomonas sp. TaxID=2901191 RepID=UPI003002DA3A